MAFKRKRNVPGRAGMRKRRRAVRGRVPRGIRMFSRANVLSAVRTFYAGNWTFGTVTTNDFWRYGQYTLASLPSVSEFTSLFDEYKINAIKVTFRPRYDTISPQDLVIASPQPQAYAHYIVDPGSTVIPAGTYTSTTLNTFLENSGVKTVTLNKPFSIYWKPKVSAQLLGGGTGSEVIKGGWVKTSDTAVTYRGYHMFLQQNNFTTTGGAVQLDIFVTYYMIFKNMR